MFLLLGVLILVIMILAALLFYVLYDIHQIQKQSQMKYNSGSHIIITNEIKLQSLNALCEHLNALYQRMEHMELAHRTSEKAIKDMLSYIAHDVRTPLTSVQGYLQLLKDTTDPMKQDAYYAIIEQRLKDIRMLLEQFFLYTKVMQDDMQLQMETCSLYEACCNSLAGFYEAFLKLDKEPQLHFTDMKLRVTANCDILQRLFDNLIQNAIRHGNGELLIEQKGNIVYFKNPIKADTPLDVERVFERFYKAEMSRTHISSGLGLSIVKEIMLSLHGEANAFLADGMFTIALNFPKYNDN